MWVYLVVRQRGAKVMRVKVASSLHVCNSDGLSASNGHPALTNAVWFPTDTPVAVGIIGRIHACHRLLATTCRVSCKQCLVNLRMHVYSTCIIYSFTTVFTENIIVPFYNTFKKNDMLLTYSSQIVIKYHKNIYACISIHIFFVIL